MRSGILVAVGIVCGIAITHLAGDLVLEFLSGHAKPYAGQQERTISSLSEDDVRQLKEGRGWGLAKPAELNDYPGPLHVLELSSKLELAEQQLEAIQASYDRMKADAARLGKELIAAERALDIAFSNKTITHARLNDLVRRAEEVRAKLRARHLAAHLEVTPLLSKAQRTRYAELRGYGAGHGAHKGH